MKISGNRFAGFYKTFCGINKALIPINPICSRDGQFRIQYGETAAPNFAPHFVEHTPAENFILGSLAKYKNRIRIKNISGDFVSFYVSHNPIIEGINA